MAIRQFEFWRFCDGPSLMGHGHWLFWKTLTPQAPLSLQGTFSQSFTMLHSELCAWVVKMWPFAYFEDSLVRSPEIEHIQFRFFSRCKAVFGAEIKKTS